MGRGELSSRTNHPVPAIDARALGTRTRQRQLARAEVVGRTLRREREASPRAAVGIRDVSAILGFAVTQVVSTFEVGRPTLAGRADEKVGWSVAVVRLAFFSGRRTPIALEIGGDARVRIA